MTPDEAKLTVEKTLGGSGSDAFTASFTLAFYQGGSLSASARGASKEDARRSLAIVLRNIAGEIQNTIEDLR